jgi:hypothetical protein
MSGYIPETHTRGPVDGVAAGARVSISPVLLCSAAAAAGSEQDVEVGSHK